MIFALSGLIRNGYPFDFHPTPEHFREGADWAVAQLDPDGRKTMLLLAEGQFAEALGTFKAFRECIEGRRLSWRDLLSRYTLPDAGEPDG